MNNNEHKLQNSFIKEFTSYYNKRKEKNLNLVVFIDQDSLMRNQKSFFDFEFITSKNCVLIELKYTDKKIKNPLSLLTDYQKNIFNFIWSTSQKTVYTSCLMILVESQKELILFCKEKKIVGKEEIFKFLVGILDEKI